MVNLVRGSNQAVIWALTSRPVMRHQSPTPIEVLKHLALQVLQFNKNLTTDERCLSINASAFHVAHTEAEWFSLLESIMIGIPQLFIVIDVELFGGFDSGAETWALEFSRLFEKMTARHTVLKVALASYRRTSRLVLGERLNTAFDEVSIGNKRYDRPSLRGEKGLLRRSTGSSTRLF